MKSNEFIGIWKVKTALSCSKNRCLTFEIKKIQILARFIHFSRNGILLCERFAQNSIRFEIKWIHWDLKSQNSFIMLKKQMFDFWNQENSNIDMVYPFFEKWDFVVQALCPKFHKIWNQMNLLGFKKSKQLYHAQKTDVGLLKPRKFKYWHGLSIFREMGFCRASALPKIP